MKKKYVFAALCAMALIIPLMTMIAQAADPTIANPLMKNKWLEQDRLVGTTGVTRPYTWGPSVPEAPVARLEPYSSSPGGQRQVQYFDKARMEINDPSNGIVTSGLAVKELVSGLRQDGDTTFTQLAPSKTQVAGDAVSVNPNAPVYASFNQVVTLGGPDSRSKSSTPGATLSAYIAKDGTVTTITPPESITVGAYESNTGHNIAKPFFDFMNQTGPTTDPISGTTLQNQKIYTNDPTTNVFGLAISEPYWVSTKVAGVDRLVLVQLFERRVLTYNPALTSSKVEMGNLGQHYYQWRYVESQSGGTTTPPPTTPSGGSSNLNYSQLRYPYLGTGSPTGNFNGATGNVNSYAAGPSSISSPVYDSANKLAIVGTAGSGVVAVDVSDFVNPTKKWSYPNPLTGVNFNSNVQLVNGVVYIGGGDNRVYALNELTGALVWKTAAAGGPITSDVLVDSTGVYFIAEDGMLYAVNLSDGTPKWTNPVQVSATVDLITAPIQDNNGILYVGGSDSQIHAFNKDGSVVTNFTSNTLDGTISARPAFANGHLYIPTSTGRLYSMNTDGSTLPPHIFTNNTGIYTSPAVVTVGSKIVVFVGSDDGLVYGVDANSVSSTALFAFVVPGAPKVRSSIAAVGNYIYFGTEDKKVYRVEAANQANYLVLATANETFGTISPVVNGGYLVIASQAGTLYFVK
jgi:outer membrane protein assembly factor BamB